MTRIEDMSETQRQAWITLIVDVAVFVIFLRGMMTGRSIDTLSPGHLSAFIISLIVTTIVLHIIIQAVFAARKRGEPDDDLKDERDVRIERKGASYGFYVLTLFINLLVGHIVLQNSIEGLADDRVSFVSVFDFTNTSHLVFALLFAAFVADIIKNATMIIAYRRGE